MLTTFLTFITHTPLYPHWLETKKSREGTNLLLTSLSGIVLEVGAGDGHKKDELSKQHPSIRRYIATDYAEWDGEFTKIDTLIYKFGSAIEVLLGYHKRAKLDVKCDAMDLPFRANTFDYHLSFETLEHISNPSKYFEEASRVLKKGGVMYFTVPFLYRMHGGEPDHRWDFFRYGFGSFYNFANNNGLSVVSLYSNTGYGTTMSCLSNQFIIRRIFEGNIVFRIFWLIVSPLCFILTNCIGLVFDIKPDVRFSTRFHVLLKKN